MPAFQTSLFAFQGAGQFAFQTEQQVTETTQPVTGGWEFLVRYETELRRRRARDKKRKELEEETERIEAELDRSIAQLLREQEAIDDRKKDLERLAALAKENTDLQAAKEYSERVATAYARAITQGNYSAIEALERELERAQTEEDFLLLSIMLTLNR